MRALSRLGRLVEARAAARDWLARDQLDAEALVYLADAVGRLGDRRRAIRLLSGIVDIEPGNERYHRRMVAAYRRAGMWRRACAHRIALAAAKGPEDARAVRCGETASAARSVRGEIVLEASWDRDVDLDISLVTAEGTRLSWLGGRRTVRALDALRRGHEILALRRSGAESYRIEISRADGWRGGGPVRGTVKVTALGVREAIWFSLHGERAQIGRVTIRRSARLEDAFGRPVRWDLPPRLSRSQIQGGMRRVRGRVQACYDKYKLPGLANVKLTISSNGRVASVRTKGIFAETPTGRCVARAVRKARFPLFRSGSVSITYPFALR